MRSVGGVGGEDLEVAEAEMSGDAERGGGWMKCEVSENGGIRRNEGGDCGRRRCVWVWVKGQRAEAGVMMGWWDDGNERCGKGRGGGEGERERGGGGGGGSGKALSEGRIVGVGRLGRRAVGWL